LSTIKDASTNEILAYHISDRITLDIAIQTSHYSSPKYQKLLKKYDLGQAM